MRLLLDTNVLIPIADDRMDALAPGIAVILRAPGSAMFFSVASLWEIAIKSRLGKLRLAAPLAALPALFDHIGLSMLDIAAAHAIAEADPPAATRDPFDRLLLGICAVEEMRLVTTDRILQDHPLAWRAID